MTISNRGSRLGVFSAMLGAFFFGLAGSAIGWVTSPADYPDVKIFAGVQSQGARVAFDPSNPNRLIAGIVARDKCVIKSSTDGGKTWGAAVPLPQLPDATCWYSPPAVAYAADGSRVYAAYMYNRHDGYGIELSISTDHGATWSPATAIDSIEVGEFRYSVELATAPDAEWIYVVVNCECYFGTNIYFTSSPDLGSTWTPNKGIAFGFQSGLLISAGSVAAGRNGDVLISYAANRDYDPWKTVEVLSSSDYGDSFAGGVVDQERSLFFGNPNLRLGALGTAHLVYSRGASSASGSSAILYKHSLRPYEMWSPRPARLDDGIPGAKLGMPRLAVGACEDTSVLHVTWVQSLNGTDQMLYTRRIAEPEFHWSDPLKVSQTKRLIWTLDLAGTGANAFSTFSYWFESPVFGTRVRSGVMCP